MIWGWIAFITVVLYSYWGQFPLFRTSNWADIFQFRRLCTMCSEERHGWRCDASTSWG